MIALCLIAGEECALITRCLSAAAPHVDEIVLLDTTADRRNRDVAREFGARYVVHPLTDFAAVRQAALNEASQPWVLVLDPDEEIDQEHLARLRDLAANTPASAFLIPRIDYYGRCGWGLTRPCRFFRRLPGVRYVGRLYEEPMFPYGELPVMAWDILLHHYGFQQPEAVLLRKRTRYLSLLQQSDSKESTSAILGLRSKLLADCGDWNAAMACCLEALHHANPWAKPNLWLLRARFELVLNRPHRALESIIAAELSTDWPPYERSRVMNIKALVLLALRKWEESYEALASVIAEGMPVAAYWVNIAVILRRLGAHDRSMDALAHAKAMNPRMDWRAAEVSCYQDGWLHRLDTVAGWRGLV